MSFAFVGMILGQESVTLFRDTTGASWGSDGRPNAVTLANQGAIQASVQPMPGEEWARLELGGRQSDFRKVYSEVELRTGNQNTGFLPDRLVAANGRTYEVVSVADYTNGPYPHWKAIARQVEESDGDGGP